MKQDIASIYHQVQSILSPFGYKVESVDKPWRHTVAIVSKNGKKYHFKLAQDKEVSTKTRNEVFWNRQIKEIKLSVNLSFDVPEIVLDGEVDDNYWFLATFVDGQPLASVNNSDTKLLEGNLTRITKICEEIIKLPLSPDLLKLTEKYKVNLKEKMLQKMDEWARKTRADVSPLISYFEKNCKQIEYAPLHGDFVPWHIFETPDKKLFLIDAEASNFCGVKFYDVAYFYHRIYTKFKRPDIANEFLQIFSNQFSMTQEEKKAFMCVLSQRLIGGYMDSESDNITSIKLQDELKEKLLDNSLI